MFEVVAFFALIFFIVSQFSRMPPLTAFVLADGITDTDKPEQPAWKELLMFKGGSSKAPAPDPAIGQAAKDNIALGKEWLVFAKEQFAKDSKRQAGIDDLTQRIGEQQVATQDQANEWAKTDRARYEDKFLPLEDKFIQDAQDWGSDANKDKAAAEARADVMKSAEIQKGAAARDMARMGIDPRSGKYSGVTAAQDTNVALAAAGAGNLARDRIKKEGVAMSADAINLGRGLPSQAAGAAGLGLQAGSSAQGLSLNAAGNARANSAAMQQGFQGGIGANSSGASIMNQQFGNQLQSWSAQQQAASSGTAGIMSAVGTGIGAYAALGSSKELKEGNTPLGDGSATEAIKGMPVEAWNYKEGAEHPVTGELLPSEDTHIGPYAEDFKKQTGLGDGKTINIIDGLGLALKGIQELDEKVESIASSKTLKRKAKQPSSSAY